jgi:hypothetical protein
MPKEEFICIVDNQNTHIQRGKRNPVFTNTCAPVGERITYMCLKKNILKKTGKVASKLIFKQKLKK